MCSLLEQFEEASQSIDSDLAFDLDFPKRYGLEFTANSVLLFSCVRNTLLKDLALILFFSCASAKAECSLSSLSCVWMYVDQNKETPPPGNCISTGNSLISSLDLDSPQKINLE